MPARELVHGDVEPSRELGEILSVVNDRDAQPPRLPWTIQASRTEVVDEPPEPLDGDSIRVEHDEHRSGSGHGVEEASLPGVAEAPPERNGGSIRLVVRRARVLDEEDAVAHVAARERDHARFRHRK